MKKYGLFTAVFLAAGVMTGVSSASAQACRQVFSHTTCTGGGWMQPPQTC